RALLSKFAALAGEASPARRSPLLSAVQAQRSTVSQDLELARYEPPRLRPGPDWFGARRSALAHLDELEAPLLLSARWDPAVSGVGPGRVRGGGRAARSHGGAAGRPSRRGRSRARRAPPIRPGGGRSARDGARRAGRAADGGSGAGACGQGRSAGGGSCTGL